MRLAPLLRGLFAATLAELRVGDAKEFRKRGGRFRGEIAIRAEVGASRFASGKYSLAARLFDEIIAADRLEEFLTLRAYEFLD